MFILLGLCMLNYLVICDTYAELLLKLNALILNLNVEL
jgi:hypothetical protein